MADRSASASVLTEIAADANTPVHLLEILFDSSTIRMTDCHVPLTWNGNEYLAFGHFLGFSDIEETSEFRVSTMTGTLSGIDQSFISSFLTENYIDRTVNLYKAFLNQYDAVISSPVLIFSGRMSAVTISDDPDGGTSTIAVEAASQWVDFERRPGRRGTNEDQQFHFPGDRGFEFAAEMNKDIYWGRIDDSED